MTYMIRRKPRKPDAWELTGMWRKASYGQSSGHDEEEVDEEELL